MKDTNKLSIDNIYNDLSNKYSILDPRSVGWSNEESSNKRLELLSKYVSIDSKSLVLDYGCGVALLFMKKFNPTNYVGCDVNYLSLQRASDFYKIPIVEKEVSISKSLILVDNIDYNIKYDYIIVNGVLQDFSSIKEVSDIINKLCKKLKNDGSMIIITPSNIKNSDMHESLLLSVIDLCSIALMTGRKFIIDHGSLGIHTLLKIENELQ